MFLEKKVTLIEQFFVKKKENRKRLAIPPNNDDPANSKGVGTSSQNSWDLRIMYIISGQTRLSRIILTDLYAIVLLST